MKILLTGGAGYIGSHTAIELLAANHDVVIVDDLRNSKSSVVQRIEEVSGKRVAFYESSVEDTPALRSVCESEKPDAAIHFAGVKAVGESITDPLLYYRINLTTSLSLCDVLIEQGINNLVFSSSATVYGEPERVPLDESCYALKASNPYGQTKIMIEQILRDVHQAHPKLSIALLRYFNPAGAHPSGELGEDPRGVPNNLVPFLTQVAIGLREALTINGDDYPTPDGTCIRDFIHVQDLAKGHVKALEKLTRDGGIGTYNLGTGKGYSVAEVVAAFEQATGVALNKRKGPRREGDVPASFTDATLAANELDWRAELDIETICRDAWRWQQKNPQGYP